MAQGGRYQNNAIILKFANHTFANLGLFEENVTTFLTFPLKIPTLHTHYPQIKGAHALLRSDWHWPRVVVIEIMELSEECVIYL